MKKLIYKNEQIATITDEEAQQIMAAKDKRQPHINFKGESLKAIAIEIRKEKQETTGEKRIHEMNTEELKEIIGDFERQYEDHKIGAVIHNDILGNEYEGIISWALEINVITRKEANGLTYWFLVQPDGIEWTRKREAMRELWKRRKYAEEKNQIN